MSALFTFLLSLSGFGAGLLLLAAFLFAYSILVGMPDRHKEDFIRAFWATRVGVAPLNKHQLKAAKWLVDQGYARMENGVAVHVIKRSSAITTTAPASKLKWFHK